MLDAGCGAGARAAALIAKGAQVTGINKSVALPAIARNRLGPDVPLEQADLSARLAFEDGAFDLVLASLAVHYLQDGPP